MASEITLKYLHPSIKTYITTENYNYDTSVSNELLFVADVFEHGVDNQLQQVNTVSEYLFKYGEPNFAKFGQAGYNIERWLNNGGSAVIMRLLPDDAAFAHAILNIQYKNATNGKTVLNSEGEETKINDVYLRPVVSYVGVNKTSESLLASELAENRSDYPTTDGYVDNFIFAVYPEGRGEYYNDLGFRIRLNPSYDTTLTSRVYTFEVIRFTGTTYDIIDGPYYVTFDPDAIDPNSQRSMFIENVVNSYSEYVKVKFNTENYIKLATVINNEVDPYIIDIITGQSRILDDGNPETYFSSITSKDEDVHISLRSYSSTGAALTKNGEYILNISNNDETTKDIIDIADNSRRVTYNNQKYVTDYMRTFYNWLMVDRVNLNLEKIFKGNIESNITEISGLLKDKAANLIYNNMTNSDDYSYEYNGVIHNSAKVGKQNRNDAWYLKAQEVIDPARVDGYELKNDGTHDQTYVSTSEMMNTITEDGFVTDTNEHLISYYNNFLKYFQFIANYDVYNNSGFVTGNKFRKIQSTEDINNTEITPWKFNQYIDPGTKQPYLKPEKIDGAKAYFRKLKSNTSDTNYIYIRNENFNENVGEFENVIDNVTFKINSINPFYKNVQSGGSTKFEKTDEYYADLKPYTKNATLISTLFYYDENCGYIRPILDSTLYDENNIENPNGKYVKVYDVNGDISYMNASNLMIKRYLPEEYLSDSNDNVGGHTTITMRGFSIDNNDYKCHSILNYFPTINPKKFVPDLNANFNETDSTEQKKYTDALELVRDSLKIYAYNVMQPDRNYVAIKTQIVGTWLIQGMNSRLIIQYETLCKAFEEVSEIDGNLKNWRFVYFLEDDESNFCDIDKKFTIIPYTWKELNSVENRDKYNLFNFEIALRDLYDIYEYYIGLRESEYRNIWDNSSSTNENVRKSYQNYISTLSFHVINSLYVSALTNITKDSIKIDDILSIKGSNGQSYEVGTDTFNGNENIISFSKVSADKYYFETANINKTSFNPIFDEYLRNGLLTRAFNKVSSYAAIISKELDGKGKDEIVDINEFKDSSKLDYSNYSLTTIFNFLVGGFEALVNNQGSITDYSNYSAIKFLMKTINNNLDLRSTYLTILNVHKNNILDLSTELAKLNASVILGEETLDELYSGMDKIVTETNYLINNIITTVLNETYTIKNLEELDRVDNGDPYAYYFSNDEEDEYVREYKEADPLGILVNIDRYGIINDGSIDYHGILPLLEKILINITGENHYGTAVDTIYGGQPLIDIYSDIKKGYSPTGLDQSTYETIYNILSDSLSDLSQIHNIITSFINEKYISEIMNTLLGTIDVNNAIILYKGKNFTINTLFEYYNEGLDEDLTQNKVMDLINESIETSSNNFLPPYEMESVNPIFLYPYLTMQDIIDSVSIAKENKEIVKNNIQKQDHVLATLNTLCYDNVTQDIGSVIGFSEGSDGSFVYDPSTAAKLKERQHRINDIRIKAYKGTWNPDVLNKDLYEFDHVLDANYEDAVKNAIITLARDERQDFFFWADTKIQNTVQDCMDWKTSFTNQTYFMSVISQAQTWYDEYTSKNIEMTSTYLVADMFPRHINNYGIQFPMAGSKRGQVGGYLSIDWYPNEEQKETLYKNKINYIERNQTVTRIGAQNTNYPTGPLGSINNMLVVLKIKRNVEKIAKNYQFEFNTQETRDAMSMEINTYLANWINNGACTVATASVYASDYDIIQKIVRVDVILQFTGVIERIVINIDCPASI